MCGELDSWVANGRVHYSKNMSKGGYPKNSIAEIICNEGFMGGGTVRCNANGAWSGTMPTCTSKYNTYIVLMGY